MQTIQPLDHYIRHTHTNSLGVVRNNLFDSPVTSQKLSRVPKNYPGQKLSHKNYPGQKLSHKNYPAQKLSHKNYPENSSRKNYPVKIIPHHEFSKSYPVKIIPHHENYPAPPKLSCKKYPGKHTPHVSSR